MMHQTYKNTAFFLILFSTTFLLSVNYAVEVKKEKSFFGLGGKTALDSFGSNNFTLLNASVLNDSIFYLRTTADFWMDFACLEQDGSKRLEFFCTERFRFRWGGATDTRIDDLSLTLDVTKFNIKGTTTNKHLLWMREGWLKFNLGDMQKHDHYLQFGLFAFDVGRGISLGSAYDAAGFLGFMPGYSIDQYAPAVLTSFNPIKDVCIVDMYVALTENNQLSLRQNQEVIREGLIVGCKQRGIGRQSYIVALRSTYDCEISDNEYLHFEPYLVHQKAPDQDLEFKNDIDTYLSTAGFNFDAQMSRFSFGFEAGRNFGQAEIPAWDRNQTKIVRDECGFLREYYTKIYTTDPSLTTKPVLAPVTDQVNTVIKAAGYSIDLNGQAIGSFNPVPDCGMETPTTLYNSFDRIRPEQQRELTGFFFVADFAYEIKPNEMTIGFGVGYASGEIDQQEDANNLTQQELLNREFHGFLPLQSVYTGTRLRHLVIFNQGIPRFNSKNPSANLDFVNITPLLQFDTVNEMTNIAFAGTRFEWKPNFFKKYKLMIGQNVIGYWAPETAHIIIPARGTTPESTRTSSDYLGVELTTEISAVFMDKLKLTGFLGFLLPGSHYSQLAGTIVPANKLATGSDLAYVMNLQMAYSF